MSKIKNTIYLIFLVIAVSLTIYSTAIGYLTCKVQGYQEIKLSSSGWFCANYLSGGGSNTRTVSTTLRLILPLIFILTFVLYKNKWDQLALNFYNTICKQSIQKESVFIGLALFIYLFTFLAWPFSPKIPFLLVGPLVVSIVISVPFGLAVYLGKKWLSSETPKKAFYRVPLGIVLPVLFLAIPLSFYLGIVYPQGHPPASLVFPPLYILGMFFASIVLSVYLYYYKFSENRLFLRWIISLIAILPIALNIIRILI